VIRAHAVRFSPTGQSFAVAATEGLLVYALDSFMSFDPMDLEVDLTPESVHRCIAQREYLRALVLALRLNEPEPLAAAYRSVPKASIELVARDLPRPHLAGLLRVVADHLERQPHLEVNVHWVLSLLGPHAAYVRLHRPTFAPTLRALHKALHEQRDSLVRLADSNGFALEYLTAVAATREAQEPHDHGSEAADAATGSAGVADEEAAGAAAVSGDADADADVDGDAGADKVATAPPRRRRKAPAAAVTSVDAAASHEDAPPARSAATPKRRKRGTAAA